MSLYSDRGDLDQLSVRRQTYMLWPGWVPRSVDPVQLADAGLYFTGEEDSVRCYSCRETFSGWNDRDVPLDVHRRRSPTCPVVTALDRRRRVPATKHLPSDVDTDCADGQTSSEKDFVDVESRRTSSSPHNGAVTATNLPRPGNIISYQRHKTSWQLVCQVNSFGETTIKQSTTNHEPCVISPRP